MTDANLIREIFYVMVALISVFLFTTVFLWYKNKKEINRITEYGINVNSDSADQVSELLETMVGECFNEYIILNIEYQQIDYINDELQFKIMKDVGSEIAKRLSPALISKLTLYYNPTYIPKIISDKVYMACLNYTIEKNSIKESKEELN